MGAKQVQVTLPIKGTGPCGYCDMVHGGNGALTVLLAVGQMLRGFCSEVCAEAWLRARRKKGARS